VSDLVLSRDEVKALAGTPQRARQAKFLRKNGIRHYLDAYDWPVVLRSSVEPVTGVESAPAWKSNKAA
jgi:hypothetical protein